MSEEVFYEQIFTLLGKHEIQYVFNSKTRSRRVAYVVGVADRLGLTHRQKFVDGVDILVNSSFYITLDSEDKFLLVGRYTEDTIILSSVVRELILSGYDLELNGHLILISLREDKGVEDTILSLKSVADKFPNGF